MKSVQMELISFLNKSEIPFERNVSLPKKTWIKTGGICGYWIVPTSVKQLAEVCRYLQTNNIKFDIVGHTSNIFFHSTYNPEVIVSTVKVNSYSIADDIITCDCGCSVIKLAKEMLIEGYAGFYGLVGLPGTVASAAINNAGCFDCSISSMLISADVLMPNGTITTFVKHDFGYEKRSSKFKRGEVKGVVLSVKLKLQKAENIEEEYRKSEETIKYRRENQEQSGKTLGSVFARKRMRLNLRNVLVKIVMRIFLVLTGHSFPYIRKKMILFLYGYKDLNNYISDRQINTFIWKDYLAEKKFVRYKEMMNKVYKNLTIEIEEKMI